MFEVLLGKNTNSKWLTEGFSCYHMSNQDRGCDIWIHLNYFRMTVEMNNLVKPISVTSETGFTFVCKQFRIRMPLCWKLQAKWENLLRCELVLKRFCCLFGLSSLFNKNKKIILSWPISFLLLSGRIDQQLFGCGWFKLC